MRRKSWTEYLADLPDTRCVAREPRLQGLESNAIFRMLVFNLGSSRQPGIADLRAMISRWQFINGPDSDLAVIPLDAKDCAVAFWGALHSRRARRAPRRMMLLSLSLFAMGAALGWAIGLGVLTFFSLYLLFLLANTFAFGAVMRMAASPYDALADTLMSQEIEDGGVGMSAKWSDLGMLGFVPELAVSAAQLAQIAVGSAIFFLWSQVVPRFVNDTYGIPPDLLAWRPLSGLLALSFGTLALLLPLAFAVGRFLLWRRERLFRILVGSILAAQLRARLRRDFLLSSTAERSRRSGHA